MPKLPPHTLDVRWEVAPVQTWNGITAGARDGSAPAVTSSLWQRLDEALVGSTRARAEARKGMASTLAGIDVSFNPHGRDARIKARAFLAQAARILARLQSAMERLESEAQAAQIAHDSDAVSWIGEMHSLTYKKDAQAEATSRALKGEVSGVELAMDRHVDVLRRLLADELYRAEVEHQRDVCTQRAQFEIERTKLVEEAMQVRSALSGAKQEAATSLQAARRAHDEVVRDATSLRAQVATLENDLTAERAGREAERHTIKELKDGNSRLRAELAERAEELEHTTLNLRGGLEKVQREKAAAASELEAQLKELERLREEEIGQLQGTVELQRREHQKALTLLRHELQAVHAQREDDARHYHLKIERLKALQQAALAQGTVRGRQLLYHESMRTPEGQTDAWRASSLTWRGDEWDASSTSPRKHGGSSASEPKLHTGRAPGSPSAGTAHGSPSPKGMGVGARYAAPRAPPRTVDSVLSAG